MSHLNDTTVAVIGGGIGGLAAALAFSRFGAQVKVFEQARALTEVGAGIQITPNGARVLNALGLEALAETAGLRAEAVQPMDAMTGRPITRFDLTGQAPAYRFFHRAALIDLLAAACRTAEVDVVLSARVAAAHPDGTVTTQHGRQRFDLVVGAEGLHSTTRALLNGQSEPFFTGQVAWRGVVPAPDQPAIARIWMAPGRHVVTYPLRDGALNVVAVQERKTWAAEGWHHPDHPENLQSAFGDTCTDLRDILHRLDHPYLWGLFRHEVAKCWCLENVALLGDAAHPTLPFLAQGANMALEDAWVLAACCNAAPLDQALSRYQSLRRPRVIRAIAAANANARNYHLSGLKRHIALSGLRGLGVVAPNAFLNRLAWLYGHDVTA